MIDKCRFAGSCQFYSRESDPCISRCSRLAYGSNGKRVYICTYYRFLEENEQIKKDTPDLKEVIEILKHAKKLAKSGQSIKKQIEWLESIIERGEKRCKTL